MGAVLTVQQRRESNGGFSVEFNRAVQTTFKQTAATFPRQRRRVTNWRDDDAAFRNRGRLIV
jgi:hypothetical protein